MQDFFRLEEKADLGSEERRNLARPEGFEPPNPQIRPGLTAPGNRERRAQGRGWEATRRTLILSRPFSAWARSYTACRRSHVSAPPPKALSSLIAISGEIAALQFTRLLRAWRVTPRARAAPVMVRPKDSMQSWRTERPGCGGFFIVMLFPPSDNRLNPRRRRYY